MTYYLTIIKDRKAEISEEKKATIHPILSPFEGPDVLNKEVSLERGITIISDMQEVDADNDQFFNVSARISEGRIAEIWVDDDFSAPIQIGRASCRERV